jgi:hypothetical protein
MLNSSVMVVLLLMVALPHLLQQRVRSSSVTFGYANRKDERTAISPEDVNGRLGLDVDIMGGVVLGDLLGFYLAMTTERLTDHD